MFVLLIALWLLVGIFSVFLFHRTLMVMDGKNWREVEGEDIIWYIFMGSVMGYFASIMAVIATFALIVNYIANLKKVKVFQRRSFYIGKKPE